jgi:hypothetical protein
MRILANFAEAIPKLCIATFGQKKAAELINVNFGGQTFFRPKRKKLEKTVATE